MTYTDTELRGNCSHAVEPHPEAGKIALYNGNDDYYVQVFETRADILSFIKVLQDAADEVFPESQS